MLQRCGFSLIRGLRGVQATKFGFSSDKWGDREKGEEKVFISKREKELMQKILSQMEKSERIQVEQESEFESKLRDIFKKYKISNEPLFVEITNLHRELD